MLVLLAFFFFDFMFFFLRSSKKSEKSNQIKNALRDREETVHFHFHSRAL